jgi:ABC-type Mn2+/Zn2+ transport system ATPase subunit
MTERALITLAGASFGYAGRSVVSGVELDVRPGSFIGILGANGSGKTTLLRGILRLLPPLAGSVVVRGSLGYVPQRERLDPVYPITVEEVVHTGAYGRLSGWRGLGRAERELALDALERVNLVERRRQLFSSLSGGQRQRALIARALVARPDVLVLDEPTSGVDRPSQELVLDLITRLNADENLAVLLVSHQLAMLRTVREVAWVAEGTVRRGTSEEMLRPQALEELFGTSFTELSGGGA